MIKITITITGPTWYFKFELNAFKLLQLKNVNYSRLLQCHEVQFITLTWVKKPHNNHDIAVVFLLICCLRSDL